MVRQKEATMEPSDNDGKPILYTGLEKAFIGVLRRYGQDLPVALYDYDKCMRILMTRDGMDEDEAMEWIEYNVIGGWVGEQTPGLVFRCTMKELCDEYGMDYSTPKEEDKIIGKDDEKDEELSFEEEEIIMGAMQVFYNNFVRYVSEVDKGLFERARQYAMDYSANEKVTFMAEDPKDKKEDKS